MQEKLNGKEIKIPNVKNFRQLPHFICFFMIEIIMPVFTFVLVVLVVCNHLSRNVAELCFLASFSFIYFSVLFSRLIDWTNK